jgi:hypothetical protein
MILYIESLKTRPLSLYLHEHKLGGSNALFSLNRIEIVKKKKEKGRGGCAEEPGLGHKSHCSS